MSTPAIPAPSSRPLPPAKTALLDGFESFWPDHTPGRPRLVLAALAVGLVAALVVPYRDHGIGMFAVFAAGIGVVVASDKRLHHVRALGAVGLSLALGSVVVLRDADWIAALCVLAALCVAAVGLVDVRSFTALMLSLIAVPVASVRGLPWLGRSVLPCRPSWSIVRTLVMSGALAWAFGALFASADALFAEWVDAVVPDLGIASVFVRLLVLAGVAAATLAFAYVGINPPQPSPMPAARPVAKTFEWLLPVGVVVAVFAMFVAAQFTVMFGGHAYLSRTVGITYADYVHQGFAQMILATALTLGVVAATVAKAPRRTKQERRLLQVALGVLCVCALVVVASAIYRIHVYEEAYGFTRLRLLVAFFEAWLGLLLVVVLAAGVQFRGGWLPLASVLTGAATLLALALINPDSYIAAHNVERFEHTGKIDTAYLAGLSADAAPALAELPSDVLPCAATDPASDGWLEWNLGRSRAEQLHETRPACAGG